jgi:hypothetical protein
MTNLTNDEQENVWQKIDRSPLLQAKLDLLITCPNELPSIKFQLLEELGSFVAFKSIIETYKEYKMRLKSANIDTCPVCDCDPCDCHDWSGGNV